MGSSEDRAGFEEFVLARRSALLRTAYLLTGHAQDAEDLVQTTLVKVVPQWRRIADNPEPYVRRAMVNENISRWRRPPEDGWVAGAPHPSFYLTF